MSEKDNLESLQDKLANFIAKFKGVFALIIGLIILVAIGLGVQSMIEDKSFKSDDRLLVAYENWLVESQNSAEGLGEDALNPWVESFLAGASTREQELKLNISKQRLYYFVAQILYENKAYKEAANTFNKSFEFYPQGLIAETALKGAGDSFAHLGDYEKGIEVYKKLTEILETNQFMFPEILLTLGTLYESQGDPLSAQNNYQRLVNDYPNSEWTNLARSRILEIE